MQKYSKSRNQQLHTNASTKAHTTAYNSNHSSPQKGINKNLKHKNNIAQKLHEIKHKKAVEQVYKNIDKLANQMLATHQHQQKLTTQNLVYDLRRSKMDRKLGVQSNGFLKELNNHYKETADIARINHATQFQPSNELQYIRSNISKKPLITIKEANKRLNNLSKKSYFVRDAQMQMLYDSQITPITSLLKQSISTEKSYKQKSEPAKTLNEVISKIKAKRKQQNSNLQKIKQFAIKPMKNKALLYNKKQKPQSNALQMVDRNLKMPERNNKIPLCTSVLTFNKLYGYNNNGYIKGGGTPERVIKNKELLKPISIGQNR